MPKDEHIFARIDAMIVADSIYADLYGLEERQGRRRSLFDYYHGRSSLAGWFPHAQDETRIRG